jgi:HK97 gp10 family phage protein
MPQVGVVVLGIPELQAQLNKLDLAVRNKHVRASFRKGMIPVLNEAQSLAPDRTGQLVEALRVTTAARGSHKGQMGAGVMAGGRKWKSQFGDKVFYGYFVEKGHRIGKRLRKKELVTALVKQSGHTGLLSTVVRRLSAGALSVKSLKELVKDPRREVEAKPFLEPAWESRRGLAQSIARAELTKRIEAEVTKNAKQ